MTRTKAWRAFAFCCCGFGGVCGRVPAAHAAAATGTASSASASAPERTEPLTRVEVVMLGDVEREPVLFERIRSLFSRDTAVVLRADRKLDQRAVLLPQRADTVYVWIRVTERSRARVYLSTAEANGQTRYLYRELRLDTGLDEVGSETLAEVAHSSAQALWLHEQQSSREALVLALERESEPLSEPPAPASSAPVGTESLSTPNADTASTDSTAPANRRRPGPYHLGIGASGVTHGSGSEGWLQEVGAFLSFEYGEFLSLRVAARYLIPSEFGLPPARVRLSGGTGELRGGWVSNDARHLRVRLEAGLGMFFGHAQGAIVDESPKAHALEGEAFNRPYALASGGLEWPLGPAWFALAADVRVPLRTTSYEVGGSSIASTSCSVCPGASLEIGVGFDPSSK